MTPSSLQSLYECRHESQEQWTLWAVAMSKAWPEIYRGLSEAVVPMDERAEFEKWIEGPPLRLSATRIGEWYPGYVQVYWTVWQAAAPKSSRPPAIEVSPELGEAMEAAVQALVDVHRGWCNYCQGSADICRSDAWRPTCKALAAERLLAAPIAPAVEQEK